MSRKIIGVTVGTTLPKPNFNQEDPTKGDYIKNKPDFDGLKSKVEQIEVRVDTMQENAYDDTELRGIVSESVAKIDTLNELVGNTNVETQIGDAVAILESEISNKADAGHDHNDKYYTETEIDDKLDTIQSVIDSKVDAEDGKCLSTEDYTTDEKDKLATVEPNANFYEHPEHTSHSLGLYKVTVDDEGHVSSVEAVSKDDIVALEIPAQDTTYDEEISDLSDRIDDVENSINTTNETLSGISQEFESYKTTNNEAVSTNASGIEANKTAIEEIQGDYLTSTDKTQIQDDITKVSEKATANASAIEILNGEGNGSVKQSIDNAFNEFAANVTNDDVVNTYKELIDYAAKHGPEFTELVGVVDKINNDVTGIETDISNYKIAVSDQLSEVNASINTIQGTLENKANADHGHEIDEINALQEFLDELQTAIEENTEDISTKADFEHDHNDLYYTKDEILESITVDDIDDICGSNQIPDGDFDFVTNYIKIDTTLTQSGQAADAKTTGDAISDINEKLGKVNNATLFTKQYLTDEQQSQARDNIGASSINNSIKWINVVESYGIDNTGKTDVGSMVQNIINEVEECSILYFPAGDYLFNTGVILNKKISIVGDTRVIANVPRIKGGTTRFTTRQTSNFTMFTCNTSTNYSFENLLLYSDSATTIENTEEPTEGNPHFHYELVRTYDNVNGIIDNSESINCYYKNIFISGFSGTGIKAARLATLDTVTAYSCGVGIETVVDCLVHNGKAWGCEIGGIMGVGTAIQNGRFEEAQKHGMVAYGANKFTSVTIDQCGYAGLVFRNYATDVTYLGKITRCGQYYFGTSKEAYLADENRIEEAFSVIYAETDANALTFFITGEIDSRYSDSGTTKSGIYLCKGNISQSQFHLKQMPDITRIHNGVGQNTIYSDKVYRLDNGSLISENGISMEFNTYDTRLMHRKGHLYVRNEAGTDYRKWFVPDSRMVICTSFDNAEQVGWSYGGTWTKIGSQQFDNYTVYFYLKTS